MAQHALPPGAIRRRTAFGLLDANGWTWAGIKAFFWFLTFIFLLAYIPNLAYYFTVGNTVDVGYNAVPIVNWCDAGNGSLPCPAPAGAVLAWQTNPPELAIPGGGRSGSVAFQSGTHLYLIGGATASAATADVISADVTPEGNLTPWTSAPPLPAPRTGAAIAALTGTPYVIGGLDASGKPTDTVYGGVISNGALTGWQVLDGSVAGTANLKLPVALSGAAATSSSNGLYVFGGQTAAGPTTQVLNTQLGTTNPPLLGVWKPVSNLPLPQARAYASAVAIGDTIYVAGGYGPDTGTVTAQVFRLKLQAGLPAVDPTTGLVIGWAVSPESQGLPEPRARATGFTANGSLYILGGVDAKGASTKTNFWVVPDATTGDLPDWQQMDVTDLPLPRSSAALASVGSVAFLFAGDGPTGPTDTTFRAGLSPKPPFFRLGLFGATIPALSIKGEIGQQLGYINAFTVGLINFAILVLIGLAFSHRDQTLRFIEWLSRGRFRAPREDEYTGGGG